MVPAEDFRNDIKTEQYSSGFMYLSADITAPREERGAKKGQEK